MFVRRVSYFELRDHMEFDVNGDGEVEREEAMVSYTHDPNSTCIIDLQAIAPTCTCRSM